MAASDIQETDLARIRRWRASRNSGETVKQLRVVGDVKGRWVVIAEERPPWKGAEGTPWESHPVARLTYVAPSRYWRLEVSADVGASRKHTELPSGSLDELLDEIDEDPPFVLSG